MTRKKKLHIWNERMLLFMEHCISTGEAENMKDFLLSIDFPPPNIYHVRSGVRGFTMEHIINAARKYKLNMNWLSGNSTDMKITKGKSAIDKLKDAVTAVEAELAAK